MARRARMALDLALSAAKSIKPTVANSWQYLKVEAIPPLAGNIVNGTAGQKLEDTAANFANGIISGLEEKIRDIDAEEVRKINEKEAAIKAEQEKQAAEAKKLAEEKKKADAVKLAAAAKKATKEKKPEKKPETKAEKKPDKKPKPEKKPAAKKPAPKDTKKK